MADSFEPKRYWEDRHRATSGLDGVGYLGLGAFNDWMYRVRARVFQRLLRPHASAIEGSRVLDVGSGTGFYLDRWSRFRPREIVGIDLSEVACARLRESFPGVPIHALDITSEDRGLFSLLGRFRFISTMDVLYHVVDDAAYGRALANIAHLLEPGGRLIFTENFLTTRPRSTSSWQVSREKSEIDALLAEAGLEIERRVPWFVLMNNPIDSDSKLLRLHWRTLDRLARRSNLAGMALGASLYPLEVALTRLLPESPTSEIAVAKKRSAAR